jgi:membrane protease YdiL (CAAX protease family)
MNEQRWEMEPRTLRQRLAGLDRILGPLVVFVAFYVAFLLVLTHLQSPFVQWAGLISVSLATVMTVVVCERGAWTIGLFVGPRLAAGELVLGLLWGSALIGVGALLVVLTSDLHHAPGDGVPWRELVVVFLPAALHEELLFRGYPFQKLYRWNRPFAIYFVALVFAALHAGNTAVTTLGLLNVFLGGVLLGYAYERYQRLWFPIGLHLAWNVMSGPILGHEVSGYDAMATVLVERGHGPSWLTGGEFGIEGSVWMTAVELGAIVVLRIGRRRAALRRGGEWA